MFLDPGGIPRSSRWRGDLEPVSGRPAWGRIAESLATVCDPVELRALLARDAEAVRRLPDTMRECGVEDRVGWPSAAARSPRTCSTRNQGSKDASQIDQETEHGRNPQREGSPVRGHRAGLLTIEQASRRMRKTAGMTQTAYAEKILKIYPRVLMELKRDRGSPTLATLEKVARPFGLKVGFVVKKSAAGGANREE